MLKSGYQETAMQLFSWEIICER